MIHVTYHFLRTECFDWRFAWPFFCPVQSFLSPCHMHTYVFVHLLVHNIHHIHTANRSDGWGHIAGIHQIIYLLCSLFCLFIYIYFFKNAYYRDTYYKVTFTLFHIWQTCRLWFLSGVIIYQRMHINTLEIEAKMRKFPPFKEFPSRNWKSTRKKTGINTKKQTHRNKKKTNSAKNRQLRNGKCLCFPPVPGEARQLNAGLKSRNCCWKYKHFFLMKTNDFLMNLGVA